MRTERVVRSKTGKRIKVWIGQVAYCPRLGGIVILGILDQKYYVTNLLVTDHFNDRYYISSDDLEPWPEHYERPTLSDRFGRLATVRRAD
jgi:hypothetical protein